MKALPGCVYWLTCAVTFMLMCLACRSSKREHGGKITSYQTKYWGLCWEETHFSFGSMTKSEHGAKQKGIPILYRTKKPQIGGFMNSFSFSVNSSFQSTVMPTTLNSLHCQQCSWSHWSIFGALWHWQLCSDSCRDNLEAMLCVREGLAIRFVCH